MKKTKIYISGQISGLEINEAQKNFDNTEKIVKIMYPEWEVINPMKHVVFTKEKTWLDYIIQDIYILKTCDAIFMLSNWKKSKGAKIERLIAKKLGLKIIYEVSGMPKYKDPPPPKQSFQTALERIKKSVEDIKKITAPKVRTSRLQIMSPEFGVKEPKHHTFSDPISRAFYNSRFKNELKNKSMKNTKITAEGLKEVEREVIDNTLVVVFEQETKSLDWYINNYCGHKRSVNSLTFAECCGILQDICDDLNDKNEKKEVYIHKVNGYNFNYGVGFPFAVTSKIIALKIIEICGTEFLDKIFKS